MSLQLSSQAVRLKLKEPFVLSYGTFHHRDSMIVTLTDEKGHQGYGEATAITYYGMKIEDFKKDIALKKTDIESLGTDHPKDLYKYWTSIFPHNAFLRSAFDCAAWDLYACRQKRSLRNLLSAEPETPISSFTLSGSANKIAGGLTNCDWPILKIKMGTQEDEKILEVLAQDKGDHEIRIDANGGWDVPKAKHMGNALSKLGIRWIEQPLPKDQIDKMTELKDIQNIEWWADESITDFNSIDACRDHFDGLNFKLMKSGGITPTLQMLDYAQKSGVKTALGCMTESSFGISALAQLAPLTKAIDMDGNLLIENDPGDGVSLEKGVIQFTERCGNGCRWKKQ